MREWDFVFIFAPIIKTHITMAKLTQNQKSIIKALTDEFEKINAVQSEPMGLIDVGGIIEEARLEKEFENECNMANEAFKKLKINEMLKDMESIRSDLKRLNLDVKQVNVGWCSFEIFPTHKEYKLLE